ncbi:hypothetical protein [Alicyclobacillus shizuokensis]|uniref:hypothetical protein n=1 Tax=Alicyclobacillus shizuokensis TaxID=392014 RepID=UPI00083348D4|nr:hypothetical protein [Alicyclobacillus shizuokensis]
MRIQSRGALAVAAAVLGIAGLLVQAGLGNRGGVVTVAAWIINILLLVLLFWAGRLAKQHAWRPVWTGAWVGAVYGVFRGLAGFFTHVTAEQLQKSSHGQLSQDAIEKAVALANSTTTHFISLVTMIVVWAIVGLIVAWLGGSTTRRMVDEDRE